jgi:hypothetical protein
MIERQMEVTHRADRVDSMEVSSHTHKQDKSKFKNWSRVSKHHSVKDKTVGQSLKNQLF